MDNNTKKLIMAANGEIPSKGVIDEVARDISIRINQAIMPVSSATAPIVVAMLREYADEIEKLDPGCKKVVEELRKSDKEVTVVSVTEKVEKPEKKRWWER